eukprot:12970977-Heterocapsa_arctica.AAC.1
MAAILDSLSDREEGRCPEKPTIPVNVLRPPAGGFKLIYRYGPARPHALWIPHGGKPNQGRTYYL